MTPARPITGILALVLALAGAARADDGVYTDPAGDAAVHRTDPGGAAPINPASVLPDLRLLTMQGWLPQSVADPYQGTPVDSDHAHVLRLDLVLDGLINPPGPLSQFAPSHDPYRYGPSPVYGFVEFDLDRDRDTGGEIGGGSIYRYLANVARFGGLPSGSLAGRAARSAADYDFDFYTGPYFERSGEDFSLVLCGCNPVTVVSAGGNGDLIFDAGETWVVRGRFFQRAAGYRQASAVFGGSDFGLYDPMVNLRFSHSIATDTTTITLVYALDMLGAAMLTGQPQQPLDPIIEIGGNHSSVLEGLQDLVNGARGLNGGPLVGPTFTLTDRWRNKDPSDMLDVTHWRPTAMVGTAYAAPSASLYAWTDIGFGGAVYGDVNGDGLVTDADRAAVAVFIAANDGTDDDADGADDGSVHLQDYPANFSPYDVTGDGAIDQVDIAFYPVGCPADWDHDGQVTPLDVAMFVNAWFADLGAGTTVTDFDHNGVVQPADLALFVSAWFGCLI